MHELGQGRSSLSFFFFFFPSGGSAQGQHVIRGVDTSPDGVGFCFYIFFLWGLPLVGRIVGYDRVGEARDWLWNFDFGIWGRGISFLVACAVGISCGDGEGSVDEFMAYVHRNCFFL